MTEKLYDQQPYGKTFTAKVLHVEKTEKGYLTELDKTLFFPEEGGQAGDRGRIAGVRVIDTQIKNGIILHLLEEPLTEGENVTGEIDFPERYEKMQNHTAEHMFSGFCAREYGITNVGFHLGEKDMTVDFDRELSRAQLLRAEAAVNRYIRENREVRVLYPTPEELSRMEYRAKLDLKENVRIVEIDGVDTCACCAPHVKTTGEIGVLKVLDFIRYKGGVRIHLLAGDRVLKDSESRYLAVKDIAERLSCKQEEAAEAVLRLEKELEEVKHALQKEKLCRVEAEMEQVEPRSGNLILFSDSTDMELLRARMNLGLPKCTGICGVFGGKDGDYKYVMGSENTDMRSLAREINQALSGRGGGKPDMIQGSMGATKEEILSYFVKES